MAPSPSHGLNSNDSVSARPKSDKKIDMSSIPPPGCERDCKKDGSANLKLSSIPGESGKANKSNEDGGLDDDHIIGKLNNKAVEELDDYQRSMYEQRCRRTMAMRLQYELYRLSQFRPLAQQYVTDDKDEETSEQLFCEAKEVGKKSWDDTSSMSSGMEWFLPSDSESEFGDDDAVSLHSSCESENRDDEDDEGNDTGKLLPEQANATCYFTKLPPEIRCLIYKYCLPQKKNGSLICLWPTKPREDLDLTPAGEEEPEEEQLPSFSTNLQDYPLGGPRSAPIQRGPNFVGQTILAVSRLIYEEASEAFYRTHTFRFNSRQIESQDNYWGIFHRLRKIEIEDVTFRFGQRSTEMKLIRLTRNTNLERIVIGPRTAESFFSVIRHRSPIISPDAWRKSEEITPYAANMYNDVYFKTRTWPALPKVVIVDLSVPALVSGMKTVNTIGPFPTIRAPLVWTDVATHNRPDNPGFCYYP